MTLQSQAQHDPEIASLGPWFHNLHLPDGRQTAPDHPLGDFPTFKWSELAPHLPPDLRGWTALDIGCNAGFYMFELARRGADVTGLDSDRRYLAQAAWAAEQFGLTSHVKLRQGTVYELARSREQWDLILFMGVLYHLRYPLLALDALAAVTRRVLVLQTLTMPGDDRAPEAQDLHLGERERLLAPGWPNTAFIEGLLADDATNWWVPNAAAVEAMARSAGFEILHQPGHEMWICRPTTCAHAGELADASGARVPQPAGSTTCFRR